MNAFRKSSRAVCAALKAGAAAPEAKAKEHAMGGKRRRPNEDFQPILIGAEAVRDEMGAVMKDIDWDGLSDRIADTGLAEKRLRTGAARREPRRVFPLRFLLAGAAAGLLIGVLTTTLFLRRGPSALPGPSAFAASGEFLQRVELEMAKRETIHYLEQSEYVLLDLLEPSAAGAALEPAGASAERARGLLAKKRYFNAHLGDVRMAKARALCDQIEILLLELSQESRSFEAAEADEIRRYVEDKQLLLRIRLMKKELRVSEA